MNLRTEDIQLPSGQSLRIREWTGADHDEFFRRADGVDLDGMVCAIAVSCSAVNEDGNRRFDDNGQTEQIHRTWPQRDLQSAWNAISKLNLLTKEASKSAEKN